MAHTIDGVEPAADIEIGRRAPRIKAEDVFAAADALLMDGHRPTIDRVRMKMGRGSPNTINEHLDTWWTNLGARLRDLPGQALPGLPEPVVNSLVHLWNLAVREARQALHAALEARESALTQRGEALVAREHALTEREAAVDARLEAQAAALTLAERQLEEANQRARSLEATLAQRDAELTQTRERRLALEHHEAELRHQLQSAQARHTAERERLNERYDLLQNRSAQEIDRLQLAQKEDKKLLKELRAQLERTAVERDRCRGDVTRLEAELTTTKRLHDQLLAASASSPKLLRKRPPARSTAAPRTRKK